MPHFLVLMPAVERRQFLAPLQLSSARNIHQFFEAWEGLRESCARAELERRRTGKERRWQQRISWTLLLQIEVSPEERSHADPCIAGAYHRHALGREITYPIPKSSTRSTSPRLQHFLLASLR